PYRVGRARRSRVEHALRAAGKHDALRIERADELVADVERVDLAVDVRLAQPPGDQLGVLRAEIENEDLRMRRSDHWCAQSAASLAAIGNRQTSVGRMDIARRRALRA